MELFQFLTTVSLVLKLVGSFCPSSTVVSSFAKNLQNHRWFLSLPKVVEHQLHHWHLVNICPLCKG